MGVFDYYLKAGFWLTALGRAGLCVTEFFPDELCGTQVYLVVPFFFSSCSLFSLFLTILFATSKKNKNKNQAKKGGLFN